MRRWGLGGGVDWGLDWIAIDATREPGCERSTVVKKEVGGQKENGRKRR